MDWEAKARRHAQTAAPVLALGAAGVLHGEWWSIPLVLGLAAALR